VTKHSAAPSCMAMNGARQCSLRDIVRLRTTRFGSMHRGRAPISQ
jgi:hypothetical protein